jgi:transcriptional regulator with XRE-family HTH domain
MDNAEFWNRVKQLIKSNMTTQEAVCLQLGISIGTMRGWITHSRLPDAEQAQLIAQALHTSVEYLVTGKEPEQTGKIQKIKSAIIDTLNKF